MKTEVYNFPVLTGTLMLDIALPYMIRQSKLIFPYHPHHEDFLDTMRTILKWSRCFGVAGSSNIFWKIWGTLILIVLIAIEGSAIYKLIKLFVDLTAHSAGNGSVTAQIAGTMFYATSTMSLILSWRLSSRWNVLSDQWVTVERKSSMIVSSDGKLKRRMVMAACFMTTCSLSNYSILIGVPLLFMSNIATILWNFQDLLIVLISMGLTSRYHRLNLCVARITQTNNKDTKWTKNSELLNVYIWRKIRDAYVKQAMLVRTVDNCIGGLILLSSSGNFYFICLQLFLGITQGMSGELLKGLYYIVSLVWLCVRFSCVVLAAADVNVHSRRALRYIHATNARCYNIEVDRMQKQLTKDYIALSGMGFFYLDRTILLQMAGAIMTYELVLIQFVK